MSKAYIPGQWSNQYESLPAAEKAAVAKEVDETFQKQTGVARALDPAKDQELVRTWLRIRDDVMARRGVGAGLPTAKVPGPLKSGKGLLTGSVGQGGHNFEGDINLVKTLLSEVEDKLLFEPGELYEKQPDGSYALRVVSLVPNGQLGPETMDRIRRFQKRVVGMADPDGLIEPNGKTIQRLVKQFLDSGSVYRLKDPQDIEGRLFPRSIYTIQGGPMMLDGLVFKRGQVIKGLDGKRLILSITSVETVFLLLDRSGPGAGAEDWNPMRGSVGGIYAQSTDAFINEYETYFWKDLARTLAPIETMIETEVNLLMGIGTVITGTAVFWAGAELSVFVAKNRHKFGHWIAIFAAVLAAREALKRLAPTLYDKLFDALFYFYIRSLKPENVANVVGWIIGKGGERLMKGKLNLLLNGCILVIDVLVMLLKNVADSVLRAKGLYNQGFHGIVTELRSQGGDVTPQEQLKIFNELKANPEEIKKIFTTLVNEIQEHAKAA
jgi:hypothetical protein